jgi:hypothetical protein
MCVDSIQKIAMKKSFLPLFLFIFFVSCNKETTDPAMNCDKFKTGILSVNKDQVKTEIEKLCVDLFPVVTTSDEWGHRENFTKLINRISQQCGMDARLDCYACIKTLPLQTEIFISFPHNGVLVKKTLDISTDSNKKLTFLGLHD